MPEDYLLMLTLSAFGLGLIAGLLLSKVFTRLLHLILRLTARFRYVRFIQQ
jgi:hypothetical protein